VLVGEGVDRVLRREPGGVAPMKWTELRDLGLALLLSVAALVLNPNGAGLYSYPFATVGITALNRYVMEWFPADLGSIFGWLLLGFVALGVAPALLIGRHRLRTADALILVGLTVLAWQAIRFLLIVGPIGGAVVAVVLAPVISTSRIGKRMSATLMRLSQPATGGRGALHAALAALLVLVGVGVALARTSPSAQESEIARGLPAGAVRWLDANEPGTRLFNRYEWGGYIGQHRPDQPIFMDGRADVYGDELLQMYVAIIGLHGDPQEVLDLYRIDYAVYARDTPLAAWFDASASWERVYLDETAAIWVRR